jgi:hypothetical protein
VPGAWFPSHAMIYVFGSAQPLRRSNLRPYRM